MIAAYVTEKLTFQWQHIYTRSAHGHYLIM